MSLTQDRNGSGAGDSQSHEDMMTAAVGSLGCDLSLCQPLCATRKARVRICACVAAGVVILAVVGAAVTLWLKLTESTLPCFFSPGDTRLISFSPFLCQSITLEGTPSSTSAAIYLIRHSPPFIRKQSFTVEETFVLLSREYGYFNYFLHPNSTFSMWACATSVTSNTQFYTVRGKSGFKDWIESPTWTANSTVFYRFGFYCGTLTPSPFRVTEGNEYYFAFYNPGRQRLEIQARMTIHRYQYSLVNITSSPNCTSTEQDCTVEIPYNSYSNALIVTDTPSGVDWKDRLDIRWRCNPRVWSYVVILVTSVIIAGLSALTVVFATYHVMKHRKTKGGASSPLPYPTPAVSIPPMKSLPKYPHRTNYSHRLTSKPSSNMINGMHLP